MGFFLTPPWIVQRVSPFAALRMQLGTTQRGLVRFIASADPRDQPSRDASQEYEHPHERTTTP